MFDDLLCIACGEEKSLARIRSLRVCVTWRLRQDEEKAWFVCGPAIIQDGIHGARNMLRRWALGCESRWLTVTVDGAGKPVDWAIYTGCGVWHCCPLEVTIIANEFLGEDVVKWELRRHLEALCKVVHGEWDYVNVNHEGMVCNVG